MMRSQARRARADGLAKKSAWARRDRSSIHAIGEDASGFRFEAGQE